MAGISVHTLSRHTSRMVNSVQWLGNLTGDSAAAKYTDELMRFYRCLITGMSLAGTVSPAHLCQLQNACSEQSAEMGRDEEDGSGRRRRRREKGRKKQAGRAVLHFCMAAETALVSVPRPSIRWRAEQCLVLVVSMPDWRSGQRFRTAKRVSDPQALPDATWRITSSLCRRRGICSMPGFSNLLPTVLCAYLF